MAWIWPWRGLAMLHKTGEDHREMRGSLGRGAPRTKLIFNANISVYLGCCGASCTWFHLHFWNSLSNPHVAWWDGFPASLTWEPQKLLSINGMPQIQFGWGNCWIVVLFEWIQSAVAIWRCWFLTCSLLVYNGYCHAGSFIYKDDYIYMYLYFYVFILIYLNNIFILQFMWGTYEPPLSLKKSLIIQPLLLNILRDLVGHEFTSLEACSTWFGLESSGASPWCRVWDAHT